MNRYIAAIWNGLDINETESAQAILNRIRERLPELRTALSAPGLSIATDPAGDRLFAPYPLDASRGLVLGRLFRSQDLESCEPISFDVAESERIAATEGCHLLERYWGRYVAFLRHGDAVHILRDPSGGLPCYLCQCRGVWLAFSRIDDCLGLDLLTFSINWDYVSVCVTGRYPQSRQTGLNEVSQLRQGERATLRTGRRIDRSLAWNPIRIAMTNVIEDPRQAIEAAAHTTRAALAAWASCFNHIALRYSAGFDSTIVLAALREAASRPAVTCLYYFDPPADERNREYLLRAIGGTAPLDASPVEIVEVPRAPEDLRLNARASAYHFPCPPLYKSWLVNEPVDVRIARERGAALFDGVYGNQLFLTNTEYAAIDYLWRHPTPPGATDPYAVMWTAFAGALRSGLLNLESPSDLEPQFHPFVRLDTLEHVRTLPADYQRRYWLQHNSRGIPPGKINHIAMLCMESDMNVPPLDHRDPERVTPLVSQPLIELFLRIPTYVLNTGGMDRGVAREAFRERLPRELLARSMVEIGHRRHPFDANGVVVRNNEALTREMLLDGALVRRGLLDRDAIESHLDDVVAARRLANFDLLEICFDLEWWLRSW